MTRSCARSPCRQSSARADATCLVGQVIGGMEGGPMLQDTLVAASDAARLLRHAAGALRHPSATSLQTGCKIAGPAGVACARDLARDAAAQADGWS